MNLGAVKKKKKSWAWLRNGNITAQELISEKRPSLCIESSWASIPDWNPQLMLEKISRVKNGLGATAGELLKNPICDQCVMLKIKEMTVTDVQKAL